MNTIRVITELCEEDRARLDKILAALLTAGTPYSAQEPTGEAAPQVEESTQPEPSEPVQETEPSKEVALSDIQQKVVKLLRTEKRADTIKIVKSYAEKVSEIPADRTAEVWDKLVALEAAK